MTYLFPSFTRSLTSWQFPLKKTKKKTSWQLALGLKKKKKKKIQNSASSTKPALPPFPTQHLKTPSSILNSFIHIFTP